MDYKTLPDLPSDISISIDRLMLFQRFQQEADLKRFYELEEAEFQRHLRICEAAIIRAARSQFFWAELPTHSWSCINRWTVEHFREQGFKVSQALKRLDGSDVPKNSDESGMSVTAVNWFLAKPLNNKKFAKEFNRRCKMEDAARRKIPIIQKSVQNGATLSSKKGAIWAAVLNGKFVVEIQEILNQNMLCIFDAHGKCLHSEKTGVSYSAMFGPDVGDVADWRERATKIVDRFSKHSQMARVGVKNQKKHRKPALRRDRPLG